MTKSTDKWGTGDGWSGENRSVDSVMENFHYGLQHRRRAGTMPVGAAAQAPQLVDGSGPSNSEIFLNSRTTYDIKPESAAKLSQTRQDYQKEVNDRAPNASRSRPDLGIAAAVSPRHRLVKAASVQAGNLGALNSSSNTVNLAPDIYSPLFLTQNLQLPRDRRTANAWNRAFYEVNPYVRNAINLHATYPISKLNIKCEDKKVENFFFDMADKLDLQGVVQNAALELWKIGEVFNYADFDESTGMWDHIYQHNPDFIRVKATPFDAKNPSISLSPDPELIKIITSNDPEHIRLRENIDPKIIHHVLMNEQIPLDGFNVSHLKMLNSPYDVRGTSIIVSAWKNLMWLDKIMESKLAQADGMINPITLIKIGAPGSEGHYPRQDELEAWRQVFEHAQFDKDFKIVTHDAVNVEQKGYNGAIIDTSSDITFIIDSILTGLMVPKSIMTQEGASYASASVALDVMRQRYNSFRTMMANWLEKKIFAPISEIQQFYKLDGGKKKLIVPTIEWNQMTLFDLDTYIGHITTGVQANSISQRTLDLSLGLNRKNEETYIREEAISKAIMKKEVEALGQMTLAELRALDPEEPIVVQEQAPLPGVAAGPGDAGGAGFDLGMGESPPTSGGIGDLGLGSPPGAGPLPGGPPEAPPTPPPPGGKT